MSKLIGIPQTWSEHKESKKNVFLQLLEIPHSYINVGNFLSTTARSKLEIWKKKKKSPYMHGNHIKKGGKLIHNQNHTPGHKEG